MDFTPSPNAKKAWEKWKAQLRTTARFTEHDATVVNTDQTRTPKDFQYGKLKLDPNSETYKQVSQWQTDEMKWKPTFKDVQPLEILTSLKYTFRVIGTAPSRGFPLYIGMHGGGGPTFSDRTRWPHGEPDHKTVDDWKDGYADSADSNNSEWAGMTKYYQGAIKSGIWVSTRGIGDSWDMHFQRASYSLLERLIENMILFGAKGLDGVYQPVDPTRVFLTGFSAGGDGVYRLANRLAQRFAAVNAAGGNPGGLIDDNAENMTNLLNTPICLQIGEHDDSGYSRNRNVAKAGGKLDVLISKLTKLPDGKSPSAYHHNVYIHPTAPENSYTGGNRTDALYGHRHNSWEQDYFNWARGPDMERTKVPVIWKYADWLAEYDNNNVSGWLEPWKNNIKVLTASPIRSDGRQDIGRHIDTVNTNPIDWLNNQKLRTPIPVYVAWDLRVNNQPDEGFGPETFSNVSGRCQDGKGRSQHYWLDVGQNTSATVGNFIKARIDHGSSTIYVDEAKHYLRILLRPHIVNDLTAIKVIIDGQRLTPPVNTDNEAVINDTLWRNDPSLIFNADIVLHQAPGNSVWSAHSTPYPSARAMI